MLPRKPIKTIIIITLFMLARPMYSYGGDDITFYQLEMALNNLDQKIEAIPAHIRRVSFYSLRVDKEKVSPILYSKIKHIIRAKFQDFDRPSFVFAPEATLARVEISDRGAELRTQFKTTREIKELASELRVDGFMQGLLYFTSGGLHLSLDIYDGATMETVWSASVDSLGSRPEEEEESPMLRGMDYEIGFSGLSLREGDISTVEVPDFARYYSAGFRISHKLIDYTRIMLALSGKIIYMYDGVDSASKTIISSQGGKNTLGVITSMGVRIPIIPVEPIEKGNNRDWLATELKVGQIWGAKDFRIPLFGIKLESDITSKLSLALEISYAGQQTVGVAPGETVKVGGGIFYEISLLRFYNRP